MSFSEIKTFNKDQLHTWLKETAGVNNEMYFEAFEGNLQLQQLPDEYVNYLWFLKHANCDAYLNIGIGNGGSFLTEVVIQTNLKRAVAVDNTSYGSHTNLSLINQRIEWLIDNTDIDVSFYNMDSAEFFRFHSEKFDVIFIDGDHSYTGVKMDFVKSLPLLNENGHLIFHDINSSLCPGVKRLWDEIKHEKCIEFISGEKCGIGIWQRN